MPSYFCFYFLQVKKALELYEQLRQRMGVVVIGPSGSGKSTIWKLLRLALGKVGQTVIHYTMNPKAMPRTQVSVSSCCLFSLKWRESFSISKHILQQFVFWLRCTDRVPSEGVAHNFAAMEVLFSSTASRNITCKGVTHLHTIRPLDLDHFSYERKPLSKGREWFCKFIK